MQAFFQVMLEVVRRLDSSAIFLSPHLHTNSFPSDKNIMVCGYLSLEHLLKFSTCIVHHGGIGTCARAIADKVPQLIVPREFDQPDNACRFTKMGLADFIPPNEFSADLAEMKIRKLISDKQLRERLQSYSADLCAVDVPEIVASTLENQFGLGTTIDNERIVSTRSN